MELPSPRTAGDNDNASDQEEGFRERNVFALSSHKWTSEGLHLPVKRASPPSPALALAGFGAATSTQIRLRCGWAPPQPRSVTVVDGLGVEVGELIVVARDR